MKFRGNSIFTLTVATVISSFGLAGCVTSLESLNKGPREFMAGGLIGGTFGKDLDPAAKRKALDAEIEALSNGNTGAAVNWASGNEEQGTVTPGQPFEVSGRTCRRYHHNLTGPGAQKSAEATACRNEDGIWEPLN